MMTTIFFILLVIYISIAPLNASSLGRSIHRISTVHIEEVKDHLHRFKREYLKDKATIARNLKTTSIRLPRSILRGGIEMAKVFVTTTFLLMPSIDFPLLSLRHCRSYGLMFYICIVGLVWHAGAVKAGLKPWFQKGLHVSLLIERVLMSWHRPEVTMMTEL
jgi:hypothetical protein